MSSILLVLFIVLFTGFEAQGLTYDYTASIECLENPQKPLYSGGIIKNPELNDGLEGWTAFGDAKIQQRESRGNKFIVSHNRNGPNGSVSQKIFMRKNNLYSLSAWIRVSQGNATVSAVVKTREGLKYGGAIVAESNCWSMLKGGLTVHTSGLAQLYFESKDTSVEIWVDSISLQPFTQKQWRLHQERSIEKKHKKRVLIQAIDGRGNPLRNASIIFQQKRSNFPFGCAVNKYILDNNAYQKWFTSRFTVTTFVNEMKWYSTERVQGKEDYSTADAMLNFANRHKISVRGHNVFWNDPKYQPSWVPSLTADQLKSAVQKRLNSVVSRYKGQLIAWDVVNENLHFSFLESKLGKDASAKIYHDAHNIDGRTTLFLNDYNTIEDNRDSASTPARYLGKLREIKGFAGYSGWPIGIGLESHFSIPPNIPYMRSSIDTLAATGSPLWLTEVDVKNMPNQAEYLEQVLREAHSHPHIEGIILWTPWKECEAMCLVDENFKNLASGDVVDKLLHEWGFSQSLKATTDSNGFLEATLFHGHYQVNITHPLTNNLSSLHNLQVMPMDQPNKPSHITPIIQFSV